MATRIAPSQSSATKHTSEPSQAKTGTVMLISEHADPLARPGSNEVGGQNVYVYNLAVELAKAGWKVDVYTRWDTSSKRRVVQLTTNVRVIRVKAGPRKYIVRDTLFTHLEEFSQDILTYVQKHNLHYDLIHTHYWMSGWVGLQLKKAWNIPLVHTPHSLGYVRYTTLKNLGKTVANDAFFKTRIAWETTIGRLADLTLTTSPIEQAEIASYYNTPKNKIAVATIGVNQKDFFAVPKKLARKYIGQSESQKIVLYAGRLEWRKGIDTLLEAFALLTGSPTLLIVGRQTGSDKQDADRLKKRATAMGIRSRVIFVGSIDRPHMKYYFSAADVCAVPSYYESFGIVPLEAIACETPVVASRVGGLKYTIRPGQNGYLFPAGDSSALAENLQKVLSNHDDIVHKVSEFTRNVVSTEFSWRYITESIIEQYNCLLSLNIKENS